MASSYINGSETAKPLEMESLNPPLPTPRNGVSVAVTTGVRPRMHLLDQVWTLIKLYMEYYPKTTAFIFFCLIGVIMSVMLPNFRQPVVRNKLNHDYSHISNHYNFKASQIDHWCLWGNDRDCSCQDFTEPVSHENRPGWLKVHESNKRMIQEALDDRFADKPFDVVFVGDEMVELMTGTRMGLPVRDDGPKIAKIFDTTFPYDGQTGFETLYLGIDGDATANLLWRLQHGELPDGLMANVYWLWIGINDLLEGYCSEEAVTLGILNAAEYLAWHDPDAYVVIQGILPASRHGGDLADPLASGPAFLHPKKNKKVTSFEQAQKKFYVWPSIQAINKELEDFCTNHTQIIYFDASNYFLGNVGNEYFKQQTPYIISELMPDFIHPSPKGYQLLAAAMNKEIQRIIYDLDEENDVESGNKPGKL